MITYALLSPTFGMHQYTAHLAARSARELGLTARVVTTRAAPLDRYGGDIAVMTPVGCRGTGFRREGLNLADYRRALAALIQFAQGGPVHFTGVHLWNVALVRGLLRRGVPVIHTLHDLAPHSDARHGPLIRLWNRLLIHSGATLLVHGECYHRELRARGVPAERARRAPLTHGFWSAAAETRLRELESRRATLDPDPLVLFFGRVERYKGVDILLQAWARMSAAGRARGRLIIAGRVAPGLTLPPLPPRTELRDRRIEDDEALDLFAQARLLALPYRDATQSALPLAAARFAVPSLVTRSGALPESVIDGETGIVAPPSDPAALADALSAALSRPAALRDMGLAARERAVKMRALELRVLAELYGPGGGNHREP